MDRHTLRRLVVLGMLACPPGASCIGGDRQESGVIRLPADEAHGPGVWPRWRGPTGQGLADGQGYPDRWSATRNVAWKVSLPGRGNSQPIVWNDRVYVTTAYDGGKRRSILCLAGGDGGLVWESSAPAAEPEKASGKNGHASSTPCTDGERVYAYFGNQGLYCVNAATGAQVWTRSVGPIETPHGIGCSPLLYRDRIILYQDQSGKDQSFIAAFDKQTGGAPYGKRRGPNRSAGVRRSPSVRATTTRLSSMASPR